MTDPMKHFLQDLMILMEQYKVEFDVVEKTRGYYDYVEGIEFSMNSPYETVKFGKNIDFKDIKNILEK